MSCCRSLKYFLILNEMPGAADVRAARRVLSEGTKPDTSQCFDNLILTKQPTVPLSLKFKQHYIKLGVIVFCHITCYNTPITTAFGSLTPLNSISMKCFSSSTDYVPLHQFRLFSCTIAPIRGHK